MECSENEIVDGGVGDNLYLENEKKKLRAEFDQQRAKMKELFLQKEVELTLKNEENVKLKEEINSLKKDLDDLKSQLVVADLTLESNLEVEKRRAEEEIASWQKIVYETVEESSSSKTIFDGEIGRLQSYIHKLQNDIVGLKAANMKTSLLQQNASQESSLAPSVVLSAVTKKLVKKLDAFSSGDTTEDLKEHEDTEVIKTLYTALEEEMKALKDKLRSTDEQLQKCRQCGHFPEQQEQESNTTDELQLQNSHDITLDRSYSKGVCDMCRNYETELVKEQETVHQLEAKVITAEKAAEKSKDDLLKEIGFRKEMEEKWNEKKEEHKKQVAELTTRTDCAEQDLKELRQCYQQTSNEVNDSLLKLTANREHIQEELDKLQIENNYLVDKYSQHSEQLQNEVINLPDTVEELHELLLQRHEELILAKIAKEAAEEITNTLRSDIAILNDRIINEQQMRDSMEKSFLNEIDILNDKIRIEKENMVNSKKYEELKSNNIILEGKLSEQSKKLLAVNEQKQNLEAKISELKHRISVLQNDLDTSETVQKDFVRLSQSLQVELEKIRAADSEVRWQHDEDIEDCQSCKNPLAVGKKKQHCRHCGHIYCSSCLSHVVLSGPNERPSKVCDVCHTLLVKSSAPYFSKEVPHSPD